LTVTLNQNYLTLRWKSWIFSRRWQTCGALGYLANHSSAIGKQERHVLNVTIHADDWFAHYFPYRVSNGKRGADKQKFSLAFTLRINRYFSVTEDSAADRLVNKQIPKACRCNNKRVQPNDATANL
jgi:hypothetical protein